jgi:hypothetical protein
MKDENHVEKAFCEFAKKCKCEPLIMKRNDPTPNHLAFIHGDYIWQGRDFGFRFLDDPSASVYVEALPKRLMKVDSLQVACALVQHLCGVGVNIQHLPGVGVNIQHSRGVGGNINHHDSADAVFLLSANIEIPSPGFTCETVEKFSHLLNDKLNWLESIAKPNIPLDW